VKTNLLQFFRIGNSGTFIYQDSLMHPACGKTIKKVISVLNIAPDFK